MSNYLNSNGLVNGKIPATLPCPWINECKIKDSNCPTVENPKNNLFSCGMARAFSLISKTKSL